MLWFHFSFWEKKIHTKSKEMEINYTDKCSVYKQCEISFDRKVCLRNVRSNSIQCFHSTRYDCYRIYFRQTRHRALCIVHGFSNALSVQYIACTQTILFTNVFHVFEFVLVFQNLRAKKYENISMQNWILCCCCCILPLQECVCVYVCLCKFWAK